MTNKSLSTALVGALLSLTAASSITPASAQALQPFKRSFPLTYGEWSARWWQWVQSMPADQNPTTDTASCQSAEWGTVFFLTGTANGKPTTRNCTVQSGKGLFFPVVNTFCAVPEDGATLGDIKGVCAARIDQTDVGGLKLTVDGKTIRDLSKYRIKQTFALSSVKGNLFANSCSTTPGKCYVGFREPAYSDGYYVMLLPLPTGRHVVHFVGSVPTLTQDVTYNLNVVH